MKSDVYFIEVRQNDTDARSLALRKILDKTADIISYKQDEFIPIKFTIGDSRCTYNISPELIKIAVSYVKKQKAKPFLFDTNVIYKGERQNAVDHLNLVQYKGFGHSQIGAPYIVADGLFGQDGREFLIDSPFISKIKAPSFVGLLDNLIVLSHVTGHIIAGYAGAIKNVAMGMSCRPTKLAQHSSMRPHIIKDKCALCKSCIAICPQGAIEFKDNKVIINPKACLGCGECLCACKFDAIFIHWDEDDAVFAARLVKTAQFILSCFRQKLFINFAWDITKECDCISNKNEKIIVNNIGILASSDILSLEKATLDLVLKNNPSFTKERPHKPYEKMLEYAQEMKLGNAAYNLIQIK